jgi:hypothetical protein
VAVFRLFFLFALAAAGLHPAFGNDVRHRLALPADAQVLAWPGVADRTIIAFATPRELSRADEEQGVAYFDLTIEIVKTGSGELVARRFEKAGIVSDAMHFDGLAIDTAEYALAPGVHAFGLRFSSSHRGGTDASAVDLRLYEVRGAAVVEVMPSVTMQQSSRDRGCYGMSEMTRTLEIAKTRTRGRADIVLHARQVDGEDGTEVEGDCRMKETRSERRAVLRYDGRSYRLPKDLY